MNFSNKILSDTTSFRTYAKHLAHLGRRETLEETINRNMNMHLDKFPKLSSDIVKAYQRVHQLKVMPSMRSMQFGGEAILKNNVRMFNCSYAPIQDTKIFSEALFLLLSGVGFGYSVQKRHINQLPIIRQPKESGVYVAHDSIQGWAEALNVLIEAYFYSKIRPEFDLSNIRPKGSYLVTTGAKAPGPEPLKLMLKLVEERLKQAVGRKLRPIEAHDIICIISDCVLSGGIRRSACISGFDYDDEEMLKCKHGNWWEKHPYRARANNSVILDRSTTTKEQFDYIFKMCQDSGCGEPGFSWSNNLDLFYNPCVTGDTEILTRDGYKRIDSLINTSCEIWNGFEWSEVIPKITGNKQEVVTISFSDGRTLTCTKYHKFHIATNYHKASSTVEAKDLEIGMKLIKHEFPILEHGEVVDESYAYTQGFISAEGMDGYKYLWVYEPKYSSLSRLSGTAGKTYNNRIPFYFDNEHKPKAFVPFSWNLKGKLDWLSGLFDGDGCELREGGLQLSSINRLFLKELQTLLSTIGIQSKIVAGMPAGQRVLPDGKGNTKLYHWEETYRICIGAVQMQNLKKLGLNCARLTFNKEPQRDASQFVYITDITESGIAETVYCFNEPKRHLGIFNGVITGQCHEISLKPFQFCNLTTSNQTDIKDKRDFLNRIYASTLLGTLQATYTDFDYLRPIWKETTEEEALLGVSFTGIADANGIVTNEWLRDGAKHVLEVNEKYAKKLGINLAARTTCVKPEGSASTVLGSSSGIHARHSDYYIRRIRLNKGEALTNYLQHHIPELVEDDIFSPTTAVVSLPQESPKNSIIRHNETALTLLNRTLDYNRNWVIPGHRTGDNKHNVSVTISVKDHEWEELREQMWNNRDYYSGISLLPFDGGNYQQAPFEDCTKEKFEELSKLVKSLDLTKVVEETDNTNRVEQLACVGGLCEIT